MAVKKISQSNQVSIKKEQRARFIEAARKAGCSEDETVFDENLKRIVKVKSNAPDKDTRRDTK